MLLDLSGGVPDKAWLGKQNAIGNYVVPKGDSGVDQFSVARGEGHNGGDCLLVTSSSKEAGLPGFWVLRGAGNGRGRVANLTTNEGYLATGPANRLSFWLRFDDGFRAKSSASPKLNTNLHVGTYHFDPRLPARDRKESNNWHFYHQLVLRHDKARDGWIHVVLNALPQHQRSLNGYQPMPNPTQEAGNYWELLTRFYIDPHPYMSDPEIAYPVRMWVDDIELITVDEPKTVSVAFRDREASVPREKTTSIPVVVTNQTDVPQSGVIGSRSHWRWNSRLVSQTGQSAESQAITLAPRESRTLMYTVTPPANMAFVATLVHSVVFSPASERTPTNRSIADANVLLTEKTYGVSGPCDGNVAYDAISLTAL